MRKVELTVKVERPAPAATEADGRVVALSARFALGENDPDPTPEEVAARVAELTALLDAAVGSAAGTAPVRGERELAELIETYRPRQRELLELLRADGEITAHEHALLTGYLVEHPVPVAPGPTPTAPSELPETARPIAAAPLAADRAPTVARPVAQLIREYQIESLKQAGAVRARRQISYEEYIALKRHFAEAAPPGGAEPAGSR